MYFFPCFVVKNFFLCRNFTSSIFAGLPLISFLFLTSVFLLSTSFSKSVFLIVSVMYCCMVAYRCCAFCCIASYNSGVTVNKMRCCVIYQSIFRRYLLIFKCFVSRLNIF